MSEIYFVAIDRAVGTVWKGERNTNRSWTRQDVAAHGLIVCQAKSRDEQTLEYQYWSNRFEELKKENGNCLSRFGV